MSEFIRKRVTKDLIEELADIDATSLELIGHKVIESIESTELVHHGINKDYKPVGHTVDTFSQDFRVVGEYSTEEDYFEDDSGRKKLNRFDKIEKDINHALALSGDTPPERIYLVSHKEEPASFRKKFNQSDIGKQHSGRVVFLDARELARYILKGSLDNPNAADYYRQFLPDFAQNLDNYEYYGRVPPACANHQSEELFIEEIERHFASGQRVCVLHGLSGSGKTQAAIDYVHRTLTEYENYIWIAGEDWKPDVPLSAIKRTRGGVAINVAGVFNASKTLLVVDDLSRTVTIESFAELEAGFDRGGRVIVTSQIGAHGAIHAQVPKLSPQTAFRILGEDGGKASEICHRFVEACRFSPLILAVIRKMAEIDDIPKEELYAEVLQMPNAAHQEDGRPIMARILQRLSEQNHSALLKIANSGCTTYDSKFLTGFIGPSARASLQRLSLINRGSTPYTLAIHDLICAAVRQVQDGSELANAVERYVESNAGEMVPSVMRQIHLCASQLLEANRRRGERNPDWLTYALLQIDRGHTAELFGSMHKLPLRADMPIAELLCIVDSKEAYSYSLPKEERSTYYQTCADEYGQVVQETADPEIRAELLHHQGKALRRCAQLDVAMECFRRLLGEKPEWHATNGQIAHMGTQQNASKEIKSEGENAIDVLIRDILENPDAVPLRVSLAALSRLRSYGNVGKNLAKEPDNVRRLADVVALSALEGFDQFYEAFLALTSVFGYHHPAACLAVAEAFPDMLTILPSSVERRQWENACEGLTNIATAARFGGKAELAERLSIAAVAFARELGLASGERPYVARLVAKTFHSAGNLPEALAAIMKVPEGLRDHWILYQKSKVELASRMHDDARATAEQALVLASQDAKALGRLSIYHEQLSMCFDAQGRWQEAVDSAKTACELATDAKYKPALQARLEKLLQKLA
ncbi:tetratricopeptide repeat protein [Stutzerimonas kunmingensis]|uniref:tetratricopeptide repeat protein n=1 Tax=Stutzerimonas kunmingensis TaxID=1211807 RepID=UPI00352651BE